jgi:hypothetical protein
MRVRLTARNFFVYKGQRNGADEIRTHDLLHAMQALSQLSYGPKEVFSFRLSGLQLSCKTTRLRFSGRPRRRISGSRTDARCSNGQGRS